MTQEPPVPAMLDLRTFDSMPLDVDRLRDSELASSPNPEVFRVAVLSWCVAWHQVPAASLPDDDATLARLLGFGRDIKGWKRAREQGGLRGWVKCSDGRLYHPVVAEKALRAGRLQEAAKRKRELDECRLKRWRETHVETPLKRVSTPLGNADETRFNAERDGVGVGMGDGEGRGNARDPTPPMDSSPGETAPQARLAAIRRRDPERFDAILAGLDAAQRLEVLSLADPTGIWPSCLEEPRKRFDAALAAAADAAARPARQAARAAELATLRERFDAVSQAVAADPGRLSPLWRKLFASVATRLERGGDGHIEKDLASLERMTQPTAQANA